MAVRIEGDENERETRLASPTSGELVEPRASLEIKIDSQRKKLGSDAFI